MIYFNENDLLSLSLYTSFELKRNAFKNIWEFISSKYRVEIKKLTQKKKKSDKESFWREIFQRWS